MTATGIDPRRGPRPPVLGARTGDFVSAVGTGFFPTANMSTVTIGAANQLYLFPRRVDGTERYNQALVEVTTLGTGSLCRVGCFANDNGRPGALIIEATAATELDLSGTGVKTSPAIDFSLTDCWVWDFIVFNNALPVMRGFSSAALSRVPKLTNNDANLHANYLATHTYGPAPATCPAISVGDTRFFLIQWRLA